MRAATCLLVVHTQPLGHAGCDGRIGCRRQLALGIRVGAPALCRVHPHQDSDVVAVRPGDDEVGEHRLAGFDQRQTQLAGGHP
ncbi:hypothetical protein D3C86_1584770 [compost metagenome]